MTSHIKNLRDHASLLAAKYGFAVNATHHVLTAAADEIDRLNKVEAQLTELELFMDDRATELAYVRMERDAAEEKLAGLPRPCGWQREHGPDGDEWWSTGCDNAYNFSAGDWRENNYNFCPGCGGKVIEVGEEQYTSERDAGPENQSSFGTGEALRR